MPAFQSLYIHFPFCETKCHYCDFYSLGRERTKAGDPPKYLEALERECVALAPSLAPQIDTIFFGGGTPSMTPARDMERALRSLDLHPRVSAQTEWTMEANPSSASLDSLRDYRSLGVNRISMGVQAMRDDLLLRLGRVHSREKALEALDAIFAAGFREVSVDLLCGVPGQSIEDLDAAMTRLTEFPITHLSCYLLTLPPHHKMYRELPNEDEQLRHLLHIDAFMRGRGFDHYEISNFAKPGSQARHNLNYWKGRSYLGLGPSAHSFDAATGTRWKNVSSLHKYADLLAAGTLPREQQEILNPEQKLLERWMLALRLAEGFPADWLDTPLRQARARVLESQQLLEPHPEASGRLRLTARGFALSDQIISQLAC